jgi:hypothetical protein
VIFAEHTKLPQLEAGFSLLWSHYKGWQNSQDNYD